MRQTTMAKTGQVETKWHVIDATDQVLGRLATRISVLLMGKHKPIYTPHTDTGDFVVVINAENIKITGAKADQKFRQSFSRYPGGLKEKSWGQLLRERPEELLTGAVRRMLPKNHLGGEMLKKLKVYRGQEHPHAAQSPEPLEV